MSVQNNIRRIREAKGIAQNAVAKQLNYSAMRYSNLENTNKTIDPDVISPIARFLGVEPGVFFDNGLTDSVINSLKPKRKALEKEAVK